MPDGEALRKLGGTTPALVPSDASTPGGRTRMSYGDDHDELISPVSTACVVLEVLARSMNPRVAVSSPKPASTVAVLRETSSRNAVWITDLLNRVNVYRPE